MLKGSLCQSDGQAKKEPEEIHKGEMQSPTPGME